MKDCDRLATALLFRADGAPPGEDSPAIEQHVRDCPTCASREREVRARIAILRSLPRSAAPASLDRAVEGEIEALESSPAEARGRLVSRWLSRLGRLPVPAALDARVQREIGGFVPSGRRRLLGLTAAAAAAAAVLLLVWTALFSTVEPLRGKELVAHDVARERIRNPVALGFVPGPSREVASLPPPRSRRVPTVFSPASKVTADALPLPAAGLDSLAVTPRSLAFAGEREMTVSRDGIDLRKFVERVRSDGTGEIELEPIGLDGWGAEEFRAAGRAAEWAEFANSYAGRTGFLATNRDFAVVDASLLLQNYAIEKPEEDAGPLLGRPTGRARFRRNFDGQVFSVAWDVETGLVLEVEEGPSPGRAVVATHYLSVQYAPRPGSSSSVALEPTEAPPPGYLPHSLPPGFRHRRAFGREVPGGGTARVDEFTDGLERIFLVQRPASGPDPGTAPFVEIRRLTVGAIELLEVDLRDAVLTVVGKLATEDLKLVLASLRR